MSRALFILIGAALLGESPRTLAAAPPVLIWQLGADDGQASPFQTESYGPNASPGSATIKDDDYYFAGTYPAPIGILAGDETDQNVERAITASDPRNRFHFPLPADAITSEARLTVTVDLYGGGAWVGSSQPGFQVHDVVIRFNGIQVAARTGITDNTTLVARIPATSVTAAQEDNVLEVERTGGAAGGYISLDYLRLEVEPLALQDLDSDGMPKWFEDTYGLDDTDPGDAASDDDLDLLSALDEFLAGTNPTDPDSDNDGLADGAESTTDPTLFDTDGDGLADGDETTSHPALADTDSDSFPDNIEIEQGSDPASATSTPFPFAGGIGLQFVCERNASTPLPSGEPAGVIRLPHWNSPPGLPYWAPTTTPLTGSLSNLVNSLGQSTTASASWSYRDADAGLHKGPSDERLLSGFITAANSSAGKVPASVTLSGIPFSTYDIIVYVGDVYPARRGKVRLGTDPATERFFIADTAPPFDGWKEVTATNVADIDLANYVRYRGLSGASQTVTLEQLDNDQLALHGLQIIDTGSDFDSDGIADADEIEHGFDPATHDASADLDGDGLGNAAELAAGTDPRNPDSDFDGILDGDESAHGTDPLNGDSDDDTLSDGDEIAGDPFPSLPTEPDSDFDGHSDSAERLAGSDPMDNASVPAPVPVWDPATRTWRWRIDDLRLRWNHDLSQLGAISGTTTMLFEAIAELDDGGWSSQVAMGLYYRNGVLTHRFRCINGVFQYPGQPTWSFYNTGSTSAANDRTHDLGFSGFGSADDSHPLRLEFTATQPNPALDEWTLTFTLSDTTSPGSPVVLATWTTTGAPSADPRLLDGTAPWTDTSGNVGAISLDTETGVEAFITHDPLGPADGDNDGMPDTWESAESFNPSNPADALLDADSDGLSNLREFLAGTDPHDEDTDNDGVLDGVEIALGTSPTSAASLPAWSSFSGNIDDLDGDQLSDAWTLWAGGTPRVALADDDGDGMSNRDESEAGTDPDDPNSRLELHASVSGSDLTLEWTDLPFKTHLIESSGSLDNWTPETGLPPVTAANGMRSVVLSDPFSSHDSRYYRTAVNPMDSDADGVEDWIEANVLFSDWLDPDSLGQAVPLSGGGALSGDARALLDRIAEGSYPANPGATTSPSPVHAARFLMQSTFGPVPEDIEHVRSLGYEAWIDEQLAFPASYLQPYIRRIKEDAAGPRLDRTYDYNEGSEFVTGANITTPWARHAVGAPDQLRQRVAFALSEMLVVSRQDAQLEQRPEALANYYDLLIKHAFGNYNDLLLDVALHPCMGWYLSHVGNQKADPSIPRYPDENFAREIMQLFTIGLWELNPDGTRKTDAYGEPIPTYDNATITELARVFTGLYYAAPYGWGGGGWAEEHYLHPMVMYPEHHDFAAKALLHGVVIPARDPSAEAGMQDVRDAVNALANHPNTAPFVSTRLIQFLVTDNPSPAYVGRVSSVFTSTGGNLGEVVRAILLDPEARSLPMNDAFGKVREPVIRTMHLGRIGRLSQTHPDFVWWNSAERFYGFSFQEPLYSPSVFNFFTPEYQAPGEIRNGGLVSPGFQIVDSYSSISFPNRLWDYLHEGFISSWSGPRYPLDHAATLLVSSDPAALIDRLDLLLCTGNMTARTRGLLATSLADPGLTDDERLAVALWTVMTSPEGAVQR